jgi:hypothetical protein
MTARDAFGLVVRTVGLCCIGLAINAVAYILIQAADWAPHAQYPQQAHVLYLVLYLIAGILLFKCADKIAYWAYRDDAPKAQDQIAANKRETP